ncbi:zinc finger protein 277-like [Ctenocephalides felis]|uniref:zinc finger protein 277-like n=1 Tax=Ctenocephalides felis TaxID=7515 RepID=UPI000E6E2A1C|nr:zinc finger protein 277-like [Ctenocephalides felis]
MNTNELSDIESTKPFGPLNISEYLKSITLDNDDKCSCILCDMIFTLPLEQTAMLTHFYVSHRLVISDVHLIPDLKAYIEFWRKEFKGYELSEYCTTMLLDQKPDGSYSKNEKYYLLSEVLPKDYELRVKLQKIKYQEVLDLYQMERTALDFSKECLFCREVITGTRISFIMHLFDKHNLFLGKYSNLVYIEDMINLLQKKIEQFICIYCDKVFKDRVTLKEHMRKKFHKQVNPKNKEYDKFYLVNYNYFQKQKDSKSEPKEVPNDDNVDKSDTEQIDSDPEWCDWDGSLPNILCLFCKFTSPDFCKLSEHMIETHNFHFENVVSELDFYKKVKVVNYIRRKIYSNECILCEKKCEDEGQLQNHIIQENHIGIPDKKLWDQPEYFFPTFDDDNFLCYLDDINDDTEEKSVKEN